MQYYFSVFGGGGVYNPKFKYMDGKKVHPELKDAIDELVPGLTSSFQQMFCQQFLENDYKKCLAVIDNKFQPGIDMTYPAFFKPGVVLKESTGDSSGTIKGLAGLLNYINDKSTLTAVPTLENKTFSLFNKGVVVNQKHILQVYYMNFKFEYVGVLHINMIDFTTMVGYLQNSDSNVAWYPTRDRFNPYGYSKLYLVPFAPYVKRAMDNSKNAIIPTNKPVPPINENIIPFSLKTMDAREGDEFFSMFSSLYTASSGAVVQSANMVSNVTTQTVASVYGVVSGGVDMIGKAGVWVYDSTVAVASAVWDLTKMSIYLVGVVLGVYLISQVGPGLKQISTTTQNSSKKRKLK
jgi:hypothetical protein